MELFSQLFALFICLLWPVITEAEALPAEGEGTFFGSFTGRDGGMASNFGGNVIPRQLRLVEPCLKSSKLSLAFLIRCRDEVAVCN